MDIQNDFKVLEDLTNKLSYYLLEKEDLKDNPALSSNVERLCEEVQTKVWQRKYSIAENSIDQDFIVIIFSNITNKCIGFLSSSLFAVDENTMGVYFSDAMVDFEYQNCGVCKNSVELINFHLSKKINLKLLNMIVTGYIHIFRIFEDSELFSTICFRGLLKNSNVSKKISEDYELSDLTSEGVIANAWNKQDNGMKDCWNNELVKKYSFPENVNYFNGDVLVRFYMFNTSLSRKECICSSSSEEMIYAV